MNRIGSALTGIGRKGEGMADILLFGALLLMIYVILHIMANLW